MGMTIGEKMKNFLRHHYNGGWDHKNGKYYIHFFYCSDKVPSISILNSTILGKIINRFILT